MSQARVVVELLKQDRSGTKLVESLIRTLDVSRVGIECVVEPKHNFAVPPSLEEGARAAFEAALEYRDEWCIYLAPRRLLLTINGAEQKALPGVVIAMARRRKPVALFLHTITGGDFPEDVWTALSYKVDAMRMSLVSEALSIRDEARAENFRKAIENAYVGALAKSSMN